MIWFYWTLLAQDYMACEKSPLMRLYHCQLRREHPLIKKLFTLKESILFPGVVQPWNWVTLGPFQKNFRFNYKEYLFVNHLHRLLFPHSLNLSTHSFRYFISLFSVCFFSTFNCCIFFTLFQDTLCILCRE